MWFYRNDHNGFIWHHKVDVTLSTVLYTVHCTRIHFSRPIFDHHIAFVIPQWYKYLTFFFCKFCLRFTDDIYIQAQLESHGVEYKQPLIRTHNAQCLCTSSNRYKKNTTILFIYIFAWIELCTWCAVDSLFFVFFGVYATVRKCNIIYVSINKAKSTVYNKIHTIFLRFKLNVIASIF